MRKLLMSVIAAATVVAFAPPAAAEPSLSWELRPTGVDVGFRGLSVVSHDVAWVSGSKGTVLRTVDGGATWESVGPPGVETLQFRDIEAFDDRTAVILSIGPGPDSRVYRTTDGGQTWTQTFANDEPTAFYDCMAFFDRRHGLALSDPVDGRFRVLSTSDGRVSWSVVPSDGMPPALPGEFAFAASGQCITTHGRSDAWIGSGGGSTARVFHSTDRGRTWTVHDTPLRSSESAGVFAVDFRSRGSGIAIGGDFAAPADGTDALALTSTAGRTWRVPANHPAGYRSGVTFHPRFDNVLIAVGPTGSDVSLSSGQRWRQFDDGSFDTVDCSADGACWASGTKGRVARLTYGS